MSPGKPLPRGQVSLLVDIFSALKMRDIMHDILLGDKLR